ncbi:hypothetical protein, partial [Neobacillus drentensis]|uniref:hypothetical protein n=1 Tax=Neobacillus drentensis TaxID=220684 RepID=UPI002FFE21CC
MDKPVNLDEIVKLVRKAEKTRHAHFMISDRLNSRGRLLHTLILIWASAVAILTFANYENFKIIFPNLSEKVFTFMKGTMASLVFI